MTRAQRRVHLWVWAVLGALLVIGVAAGLAARPGRADVPSSPGVRP